MNGTSESNTILSKVTSVGKTAVRPTLDVVTPLLPLPTQTPLTYTLSSTIAYGAQAFHVIVVVARKNSL